MFGGLHADEDDAHLSAPIDAHFKATADDVKAEADEPVDHTYLVKKKKKTGFYSGNDHKL